MVGTMPHYFGLSTSRRVLERNEQAINAMASHANEIASHHALLVANGIAQV
jgi:hypothetical protein